MLRALCERELPATNDPTVAIEVLQTLSWTGKPLSTESSLAVRPNSTELLHFLEHFVQSPLDVVRCELGRQLGPLFAHQQVFILLLYHFRLYLFYLFAKICMQHCYASNISAAL